MKQTKNTYTSTHTQIQALMYDKFSQWFFQMNQHEELNMNTNSFYP